MTTIADIIALKGQPAGISAWIMVDQDRINRFAEATGDFQFIHVNPTAAAATPFGGTVAHGMLTLSLLPAMIAALIPFPDGMKMAVNYGFNKVRFIAPVPSGSRVRGHFTLLDVSEVQPARWQQVVAVSVEIENHEKPALAAEWMTQYFL